LPQGVRRVPCPVPTQMNWPSLWVKFFHDCTVYIQRRTWTLTVRSALSADSSCNRDPCRSGLRLWLPRPTSHEHMCRERVHGQRANLFGQQRDPSSCVRKLLQGGWGLPLLCQQECDDPRVAGHILDKRRPNGRAVRVRMWEIPQV
jgi:hypothetical protein